LLLEKNQQTGVRSVWLNQQTMDAMRLMTELARHWPNLQRASELSQATGVSILNVQKTVHDLSRTGLVVATRGRGGGARLAQEPMATRVSEIVRAFEPKDCPVNFMTSKETSNKIDQLIFKSHRAFFQHLETTLLSDLV
jgi:Rrf2 family transcriptional regulator, nitric oxide-sensitive transcriptional repressor